MTPVTHIDINKAELNKLIEHPINESIVMLNFLKFKEKMENDIVSGEVAYKEYMKQAYPFFQKASAEILFFGRPQQMLIGPQDEILWDKVLVVKYASATDFINMIQAEGYPSKLREKGLQDSRLISCSS